MFFLFCRLFRRQIYFKLSHKKCHTPWTLFLEKGPSLDNSYYYPAAYKNLIVFKAQPCGGKKKLITKSNDMVTLTPYNMTLLVRIFISDIQ